jgi:hypothetical protein
MEERSNPEEDKVPGHCRVWTFAKGGDELSVEHSVEGEMVVVTLIRSHETGDETIRVYEFPTESAADEFHANLDASLLQFGWMFVGYLPNRRIHHERRHDVRRSDRRRWWTDGGTFLE